MAEMIGQGGTQGAASGRARLLMGAASVLAALSLPSFATAAPAAAPASGKNAETVSEIIVTAQKREEALQKVPISISVIGGRALDRSTASGVADVLNTVPGVASMQSYQGGGTLVTVRGVTAGEALFNGAGTVGYYLDYVPFGVVKSAIAPDAEAYDLQRVEVLRGPQGTLYGANALNGVVRILTQDADLSQFQVKVRGSVSGTEGGGANERGDMALNVPLLDGKLGARVVLGYQDSSGWIDTPKKRDFNDAQLFNARLKLNAEPTDRLSIGVSLWASRDRYGGPSTGERWNFNSTPFAEPIRNDFNTAGLKVAYAFDHFTVSSQSGYLDYSSHSNLDFTPFVGVGSELTTAVGAQVYSEELLANSTDQGPWRWSLGAMYRRAKEDLVQTIPEFAFGLHNINWSNSYAVYGELTRAFDDGRYELTLGYRFFHDRLTQLNQEGIGLPFINAPVATAEAGTPRVVLAWHPAADSTVYASYSEGFRSGFPQAAQASIIPAAKPDLLKNYEVGTKGRALDGRLSFDAALYYIDWERVQENVTVAVNGLPFAATINGKSASGAGVDLSAILALSDSLTANATFSWNGLKSDTAVFSGGALLFPKGGRLNFSPEYTAGVGFDYHFPIGGAGLTGRLSASANYTSEQDNRVLLGTMVLNGHGDPLVLPKMSFAIESPRGWTATAYVDNLSDYHRSPTPGYGSLPEYFGRVRPRTAGIQLEYRY